MPLINHTWKLTPDQSRDLAEYLESFPLNKSEAGRIALARLLARKPTLAEIDEARVTRGTNNIAAYNKRRAGK